MPLTIENSGALVVGGISPSSGETMQPQKPITQPPMQLVEVVRAFIYNKEPTKVGAKINLPKLFAIEMRAANKVKFVETAEQVPAAAAVVPPRPAATAPVAAAVRGPEVKPADGGRKV